MQRINARFFLLDLETEAGTYVKEFVHGDMGRTQPSLAGRTPPTTLESWSCPKAAKRHLAAFIFGLLNFLCVRQHKSA